MTSPIVAYTDLGGTVPLPRLHFLQPYRPGLLTNGFRSRRPVTILLALALSALLLGCVTQPRRLVHTLRYEHGTWQQLPGWDADNLQEAWNAFLSADSSDRER